MKRLWISVGLVLLAVTPLCAEVRLSQQFGNSMVLQREVAIPVWGWADPGDTVTVSLAGTTATTTADANGAWRVSLPPQRAGGPHTFSVAGRNRIEFSDVLVGEVWLCAGQSNMGFPVSAAANAAEAVRDADCASLRLFRSWYAARQTPQNAVGGAWVKATPASVKGVSAVAYFFGRKLQRELGVPVGIIPVADGGTRIESWMSRASLNADPELKWLADAVDDKTTHYPPDLDDTGWQAPSLPDADWHHMTLPQAWDATVGMDEFNGVVWFRRTVEIPAPWENRRLVLHLGPIDDGDSTYFNGTLVGAMNLTDEPLCWKIPREYSVPAEAVKAGPAVIAIRVSDQFAEGGILGTPEQMSLSLAGDTSSAMALAGPWRFRKAARWPEKRHPTSLYNGFVAPWTHYAIGGVAWYQGEANVDDVERYRHLLPAMIQGWRESWGRNDLPFLIVQLPNYGAVNPSPNPGGKWPGLREVQAMTAASLPHVGLAVTIDLGDTVDLHPKRKQEVGDRLALQALGMVYQRTDAYSGPVYTGMAAEGRTLRLKFKHVEGGLHSMDGGPLRGFAIAGADKEFVWADARIDGDSVVVSHADLDKPLVVRHAWAQNPLANLTNATGLPAGPFRTAE